MYFIPFSDARSTGRRISSLYFSIIVVTFLLVNLTTAHSADAQWNGTVTTESGVRTAHNPSAPMQDAVTVPLHQQWRRGADDSEEVIFGLIDDIAIAADGTIYVLDAQLCEVQVFSKGGEYIRTIGRRGEGPGEFSFPRNVFLTPEGLVAVVQSMPGKIIQLTPEGDAADNYRVPETDGVMAINGAREAGGRVFLHMRTNIRSDDNQFFTDVESLVGINSKGEITTTMATAKRTTDLSRLEFDEKKMTAFSAWAGSKNGTMYVADNFDSYEFKVWSPEGKLVQIVERPFEPRVRSSDERSRRGPLVRIATGDGELKSTVIKSKTDRVVMNIFPRANGVVWVLSSRGAFDTAEGELCTLDEFDAEGRFVRELHLMGEGNLDKDALEIVGNRVFVLTDRQSARYALMAQTEDDDGTTDAAPMTVICYELDGDLSLKG